MSDEISNLKNEIARLNIRLAEEERALIILGNKKRAALFDPLVAPFKAVARMTDELTYRSKIKKVKNMKVAVHIHLFYQDLAPEFVTYLKNIPADFDLFVTTPDTDTDAVGKLFDCFKNVRVITVPNKGRDIGAFLTVINQIDLNAYDVIIKLHSKKSLGRDTDGNKWRKELIKPMLGSKAKATLMLYAFYKRKKLGMYGAKKHLSTLGMEQYRIFFDLCERLKIQPYPFYFKGTMFAIRPSALEPLKNSGLSMDDMTERMERSDGYLEHALERTFGSLCAKAALTVKGV
ncbi:lipopolysaccharide biosynthesis protein [Acetobacter sp. CAG:977]|nr:lipopolysaccharide biosynthesis protein [Acetobacter sp. CAG:977]